MSHAAPTAETGADAGAEAAPAPVKLAGEAREVALAEAQNLLQHVQDERRRDRVAALVADIDEGEVAGDNVQSLEELLELGLVSGRLRSVYGPEGEQAALKVFRKLPLGKELSAGAKEITQALSSLEGRELEKVSISSVGPGAYVVTLGAGGLELSVRFDRQGARLHTVAL